MKRSPTIPLSFLLSLTLMIVFISACAPAAADANSNINPEDPATTAQDPQEQEEEPEEPVSEPTPSPNVPRIKIRNNTKGAAEFYNTATGERFLPRGFNYVHFLPDPNGNYLDQVMSTDYYNPDRVREAFHDMKAAGYNTVRIFFDVCSYGPGCFANQSGEGLNPGYLDNMVDLMHIAGQESIYIIFTANAIPDGGGYPQMFDTLFEEEANPMFSDWRNADWIHPAGVETKRKIWQDLMAGMQEREAPFETVLGWQLTNEFWYWGDVAPPFSLSEGEVTIANGKTYDMASQEQKTLMAVEGLVFFMEQIVPEIKAADPEALTTMGFYAPYFGPERYIVTPELLHTHTPIDFWDFHAYYDAELTVQEQAESFGMIGYTEKPIILGETAAGHEIVPSAASALTKGLEYIAQSCQVGFQGWLYWGYYPWPDNAEGAAWVPLEDNNLIFNNMAPINQPDPCVIPETPDAFNAAYNKPVQVSASTPEERPEYVVDSNQRSWNSGGYAPQWIEIDLLTPTSIERVAMNSAVWPPGINSLDVIATQTDGTNIHLGTITGFVGNNQILAIDLPDPLPNVQTIRLNSTESSGWVSWVEVEAISRQDSTGQACLGTTLSSLPLLADPVEGSDVLKELRSGDVLAVTGTYTDPSGTTWARNGMDGWVIADSLELSGDCDLAALTVVPDPPMIPITFRVTAPADPPGDVFMTGQFPGMDWVYWNAWMIVLSSTGGTNHEITIPLPLGSEIEYKFTRQTWETVERSASCEPIPNHTLVVSEPTVVTHEIGAWRDVCIAAGD